MSIFLAGNKRASVVLGVVAVATIATALTIHQMRSKTYSPKPTFILEGHDEYDFIASIAWCQDGSLFASSGSDKKILIRDTQNWQVITVLQGHSDRINSMKWGPQCKRLGSRTADGEVLIWDIVTGKIISQFSDQSSPWGEFRWLSGNIAVAISEDRVGEYSMTINVWDIENSSLINSFSSDHYVWALKENLLAIATDEHFIEIRDILTSNLLHTSTSHSDAIQEIAWHPERNQLASGSKDGEMYIWDIDRDEASLAFDYSQEFLEIAWKPDGSQLAVIVGDRWLVRGKNTLYIWDMDAEHDPHILRTRSEVVMTIVRWHPTGDFLAVVANSRADLTEGLLGSYAYFGETLVWDSSTGDLLATLKTRTKVGPPTWSPDGSQIAIVVVGEVYIWQDLVK